MNRSLLDARTQMMVVIVLGVVLRSSWISAPLASDELADASIWAQMPLSKIVSNYQYPNNHIFLTLILAIILKIFGVDEIALRLPVLICGILSIYIVYLTVIRITRNISAASGAAFLLAISPQHIYYSTNARGYILIMVFSQIVLYRAIGWIMTPERRVSSGDCVCLGTLCLLGTWTVPTFVLFDISLGYYFISNLFWKDGKGVVARSNIKILLTLIVCLLGFYVQYYILIPTDMLKMGMANAMAASNTVSGLLPDILAEWVQTSLLPVMVVLAMLGAYHIHSINSSAFHLLTSLMVIPPLVTMILCLTNILTSVPHARVFIYLLPIFFILVAIGGCFVSEMIAGKLSSPRRGHWVYMTLFLPVIFISTQELHQRVYPERQGREPFHKVLRFIANLGPRDLIIASNKTHVGFYLYGANEMRKRVENIIDAQELGAVYFLVYSGSGGSDMQRVNESDTDYFKFTDHIHISTRKDQRKELLVPAHMFDLAAHYNYFDIYKIKPQYVHPQNKIKSIKDMQNWSGTANVRVEPYKTMTGTQPVMRFDDLIYLVSQDRVGRDDDRYSLNINLLSSKRAGNEGVFYLNVQGEAMAIANSWLANAWTMDHPYGNTIYNREWNPVIFLSDSKDSRETIRTQEAGKGGAMRGVQSYRLVLSDEK